MKKCACCSGREYADCCEPIISGRSKAGTGVELMRARYTAYTLADIDFLYKSSGPQVRKEFDEKSSREWAEKATWGGLEILATEGCEEGDDAGTVEFVARYSMEGTEFRHRELAEFERVKGDWRFMDGVVKGPDPHRREAPKVGRNSSCPCGSGKKYKKCCEARENAAVAAAG